MPIYEYQCDSCGYRFEVKQSIKDAPLTTCERCGQGLRRLISSPGIMFKGSGWYVTDYSNKLKPPPEGEKPATGEKKETPGGTPSPASTTAAPASTTPTPASPSTTSSPPSTPSTTNTPKS